MIISIIAITMLIKVLIDDKFTMLYNKLPELIGGSGGMADAQDSDSCPFMAVWVQVPSSAVKNP